MKSETPLDLRQFLGALLATDKKKPRSLAAAGVFLCLIAEGNTMLLLHWVGFWAIWFGASDIWSRPASGDE